MGTTLSNGVYLPDEGERNCYAGLKVNWEILNQKVADIVALQSAIAGALHREIVESLPTTDIDPNTIYMILSGTSATENVYNEFMYVNNAWELIGTSATDLTNYYTKAEVDGKLLLKASASDLTSHTGDTTIHVTTADKNRWNNNTYVFRYSSTALVDSSTNSNTLLDNIDNLKVGDKVIDSSGVLFSITAIDTQNSTFTIGTALIDLAQDSDVVHKSGNETIGGEKTFSDNISTKKIISNVAQLQINAKSSADTVAVIAGANASEGGGLWIYGKDSGVGSDCRLQIYNTSKSRYERVDLVNSQFLPAPSSELDCGSYSYKWKSFNGLNPGCLSLPDFSNAIDISSYITVTGGSTTNNTYTPSSDGYISVNLGRSSGAIGLVLSNGKIETCVRENTFPDNHRECGGFIPVQKNDTVVITSCLADSIIWAYFIPCLGNV